MMHDLYDFELDGYPGLYEVDQEPGSRTGELALRFF